MQPLLKTRSSAVVVGLVLGVQVSITPPFFWLIAAAGFFTYGVVCLSRSELGSIMTAALCALLVGGLAYAVPLGEQDRTRLHLSASCVEVREVARLTNVADSSEVGAETLAKEVCFSSAEPSLREVVEGLHSQQGLLVISAACGHGSTLLWGLESFGQPTSLQWSAQVTR
jgi:hypothetical protein